MPQNNPNMSQKAKKKYLNIYAKLCNIKLQTWHCLAGLFYDWEKHTWKRPNRCIRV